MHLCTREQVCLVPESVFFSPKVASYVMRVAVSPEEMLLIMSIYHADRGGLTLAPLGFIYHQ